MPSATDRATLQKRVVLILALAQVLGGIGVAAGAAVGSLLAASLASDAFAGIAIASSVIGAAVIAIPVTRLMTEVGRRPGLVLAYAIGVIGAILVVAGAAMDVFAIALVGMLLAGGGTTATLQSRYAATDLADSSRRGRDLSTVVWATTIGSVLGPNLADPMGELAEGLDLPRLSGPFLLTIVVYLVAMVMIFLLLRPDPLIVAREDEEPDPTHVPGARRPRMSMKDAFALIRESPSAFLGLGAMVLGHVVMVAVMSMTPVHLQHSDQSLRIIGLVISGHITGMYIASPLVGNATDRVGRRQVILAGAALLLASFVISGTANGHESAQLMVGLFLLGIGWSCTMISGSTMLTESIPLSQRPGVQGTADLTMGICGASAGLLSGLIVGLGSYTLLNAICAGLIVLLLVWMVRERGQTRAPAPELSLDDADLA
jgi:MFS family permease